MDIGAQAHDQVLRSEIHLAYEALDALIYEASSYEHLSMLCASCDLRDTSKAHAALLYENVELLLHRIGRLEQILSDADYAFALSFSLAIDSTEAPMSNEGASWIYPKKFTRVTTKCSCSALPLSNSSCSVLPLKVGRYVSVNVSSLIIPFPFHLFSCGRISAIS